MKILIKNEKELISLSKDILEKLSKNKKDNAGVIALYGELGAGKTTFTKKLAENLQIHENVTSPTFVIIKNFEIPNFSKNNIKFKNLIHIDTYRLDLPEELERLGFKDLLNNPDNLIVIEWPEIVEEYLPEDKISLKFKFIDSTTREIEIN